MADYNSDRTGANIDATLDKVDALDAKIQPTGTGVNVDGRVLADEVLVNGVYDLKLRSGLSELPADDNHSHIFTTAGDADGFFSRFGALGISSRNINTGSSDIGLFAGKQLRLLIDHTGDVSFYEDTGTTAKMVWSSSAESLSIGSTRGLMHIGTGDIEDDGNTIDFNGARPLSFSVSGSERARIDSSGEFLVGTTSYPSGTVFGTRLNQEGAIECSRDGNISALFNRSNSDGEIVRLQKDGSTVGSIGSAGNDLIIGTGTDGIRFIDADPSVSPYNPSGLSLQNGVIDLGRSNARFKDLYLSGSVKGASVAPVYDGGAGGTGVSVNYFKLGTILIGGSRSAEIKILGTSGYGTGTDCTGVTYIRLRGDNDSTKLSGNFYGETQGLNTVTDVAWKYISSNKFEIYIKTGTFSASNFWVDTDGTWENDYLDTGSTSLPSGATSFSSKRAFTFNGIESVRMDANGLSFDGGSNHLDDYETGTWTPVVKGQTTAGTYTTSYQNAKYIKIGKTVTVNCNVSYTSHTGTGLIIIEGLPFTGTLGAYNLWHGALTTHNFTLPTGTVSLSSRAQDGQTYVRLFATKNGLAQQELSLDGSGHIQFSITYEAG